MTEGAVEHIAKGSAVEVLSLLNKSLIICLVLPTEVRGKFSVLYPYRIVSKEVFMKSKDYAQKTTLLEIPYTHRMPASDLLEYRYLNELLRQEGIKKMTNLLGEDLLEALKRRRMYVGA